MTKEESAYNTPDFVFGAAAPENPGALMPSKVGFPAPEFEVKDLEGQIVRLSELRARGHVVFMTGAITSPMCAYEIPAFNRLREQFEKQGVYFFLLYTRESHPAENYPHHTSWEQKASHARELQRLEDVRVPILVDDLAGTIHRNYCTWPNAAFVIHKDGRLVYRCNIMNSVELGQYLEDLTCADRLAVEGEMLHTQYSERVVLHHAEKQVHHRVYERAGPKAFEDYWKVRPDLRNRWP